MKIEIQFDGGSAKTLINGKPVNICSDIEHNFMFRAFDCIKKHIEREKKYGNNVSKLYQKG